MSMVGASALSGGVTLPATAGHYRDDALEHGLLLADQALTLGAGLGLRVGSRGGGLLQPAGWSAVRRQTGKPGWHRPAG